MTLNPPTVLPPVPPPVVVNLESSLSCNLQCRMCAPYLTGSTRKRDVMSAELLAKAESELINGAEYLSLTLAGEPFMNRRLAEFVDCAERTGSRLQLVTNGTLIRDTPLLRRIVACSQIILFSVDTTDPEQFRAIRAGADFEQVCRNIELVVRLRDVLPARERPRLGLSTVVMRQNIEQLVGLVELCHRLGLDRVGAAHLTVFEDGMDHESLRHHPTLADRCFQDARKRAIELGVILTLPPPMEAPDWDSTPSAVERAEQWMAAAKRATWSDVKRTSRLSLRRLRLKNWTRKAGGEVPCRYLQNRAYVALNGDVTPCCMPGRPVAGNLNAEPFQEIWNGPVLTAMRKGFIDGKPFDCCAHCNVNHGTLSRPNDEHTVRPPTQQITGSHTGE